MPRSVRDEVTTLVAGLGEAISRSVDDLSRAIASRAENGPLPPGAPDPSGRPAAVFAELHQDALAFGSTLAAELDRLAADIARVDASAGSAARQAIGGVAQYAAGWIEGGGVVLPLLLDLDPSALGDAEAVAALLRPRLAFLPAKVAVALAPVMEALPSGPAPSRAANARLAVLLAKAAQLGVRIKNVPELPSDRFLDKLGSQLAEVEAKRQAALGSTSERTARLAALLAFAERLKVRVKQVPAIPTDSWLDKMEDKLAEVAAKKDVPLPAELRPSSTLDTEPTSELAPDRYTGPLTPMPPLGPSLDPPTSTPEHPAELDEERRSRVEALLEHAAEHGLDLGSVPSDPSDQWIATTQAKLDGAIERRHAERKAERKRKQAERKARVERLETQARELGVDIGPFPPFPTEDWLARAELRVQAALLSPAPREASDDHERAQRIDAVVAAAVDKGVALGDLPPDPDEVWLTWAEGRVRDAEASEEAIVVASDSFESSAAFLVFEEGTVQEQSWPIQEEEVTVGRGRGNTVQIRDDAGVSRRHCTIVQEAGRFYLRDEGSTKGTLVNGRKESGQVELQGGEIILCGETKFVFRIRYGA